MEQKVVRRLKSWKGSSNRMPLIKLIQGKELLILREEREIKHVLD